VASGPAPTCKDACSSRRGGREALPRRWYARLTLSTWQGARAPGRGVHVCARVRDPASTDPNAVLRGNRLPFGATRVCGSSHSGVEVGAWGRGNGGGIKAITNGFKPNTPKVAPNSVAGQGAVDTKDPRALSKRTKAEQSATAPSATRFQAVGGAAVWRGCTRPHTLVRLPSRALSKGYGGESVRLENVSPRPTHANPLLGAWTRGLRCGKERLPKTAVRVAALCARMIFDIHGGVAADGHARPQSSAPAGSASQSERGGPIGTASSDDGVE
jgi:hypothetical protein